MGAIACGSGRSQRPDAPATDDAAAPLDGPPGCQPAVLLAGGSDVGPQGWAITMQPPATLSYGADFVKLETTTSAGATAGGQLLLGLPGAISAGKPFKLEVTMLVESVNPHNKLDSAAAILGSFTPPFGTTSERSAMIYLDADQIGWADGTQRTTETVLDGAYHAYELSVDAAGAAQVRFDGVPALTRTGLSTGGTIAIGDQTNDPGIDSVLRIRSVTKLCP